ncbi:hypothetical protein ABPG72_006234 [Tetrahymena utriculariae]
MRTPFFSAIFTFLLTAQYVFTKQISFSIKDCKIYQDFRSKMVFTCMSNIYIGTPQQKQPMSFILSNPLSLPIADTMNFVFNTKCSNLNKCKYAQSNFQDFQTKQLKFFDEKLSLALEILQKNYTKDLDEYYVIQGDLESDNFYLSRDDQPIQLEFISVYNFTQTQYVENGFINLVNGNKNGIFIQGYLQNKFKDVQMVGLTLGDTDMIAYAHFQTFIIQTYVYSALPINIAKYLKLKYSKYFSNSYNILQNCNECQCASYLPSLEVYTSKYKINIPLEEFMFINSQSQCEINISSSNLFFGIRQILFNGVIFNPLEGELQFPGAQQMLHPSISPLKIIFIQSHMWLILVLGLLFKYERNSLYLKSETDQFNNNKNSYQQLVKMTKQLEK